MATNKIAIRRDAAANWTAANPTLVAGELALETDSHKLKNGDGATAYTSLGYLRPINAVAVTGNHTVASNEDVVNVNAASATITLPAADVIGRQATVRKLNASAGTVNTQPAGADTIDGGTSAKALKAQFGSATFEVVAIGSWSMVHRYEDGTWTPVVTSAGGAITAYGADGRYTLVGNLCSIRLQTRIDTPGTASGQLNFSGLPYTALASAYGTRDAIGVLRDDAFTGVLYQFAVNAGATTGKASSLTEGAVNWASAVVYTGNLEYRTAE